MKVKKFIASLLILVIMISLLPIKNFAANTVKFSITPSVTEVHPGDEITYTVKMSAVQNLAGMKFKLVIPEGLTFIEGKEVDGIQETLNSAKAEFTPSTKVFVAGSCNYSSNTDTTLMTFKCSVDADAVGEKEVTFIIDNDDIFDTSEDMVNIPVDYSNPGSKVEITIPSTGISLNETNITLEIGTNKTLIATLDPTNSTDKIDWKSDAPEKASVDENGNVTAVSEGNAVITAKTTSGQVATCNVTVIKPVCKHTSLTTVPAKQPTCTVTGNNEYKICDNCGKVFKMDGLTETTIETETIEALGHDFSIPRYNETQHWNECSRCGISDTKINHTAEGDYQNDSVNHWKVCGCGTKVDVEAHTPGESVKENVVSATCTKEGSYDEVVYCSVCNYEMSRTPKTEPAKGHTTGEPVKENVVPATCTEEGSYDEVIYCSVCGEELSRTEKTEPAKGHTAGEPVKENIVPATCTAKGSYDEVVYCTVCNAEISRIQKETDMIPHDVSLADWSSDETNHWKECGCGTKVDIEPHTAGEPVKENIVPATCTERGSHDEVIYCSVCNREMSRTNKIDEAIGHTEGEPVKENVVPATCTEDGHYDEVIYCSVCGDELSRTEKIIPAKGHTAGEPVKENVVSATCTEEGSYDEVINCSVCGEELSRTEKIIPAKGHTEGPIVIENEIESTVDKEGSYDEVIYCTECDKELHRTKKTTPKFVYEIIEGANSSYDVTDSNGITIKANGKFDKFKGIEIDGKEVDKSNYIAKAGSTIVTLKTDYLNTLSIGEHKIKILYDDGEVETTFKVIKKVGTDNNEEEPTSPKTDDLSNITLWKVGLTVSGILFVIILGCKIKETKRKGRH